MGKKKKRKRKRKQRRANHNSNKSSQKGAFSHKIPRSLLDLPTISGPKNTKTAEAYYKKFMAYKNWLRDNGPDADLDDVMKYFPYEYSIIIKQRPEWFPFYRDSIANYLNQIFNLWPWRAYISSILHRFEISDPQAAHEFYEVATDASKQYGLQTNRAIASMYDSYEAPRFDSKLRAKLRAYCELYEVDFTLWFLGTLAVAMKTDKLKTDCFGGPNSKTSQGSLVRQVAEALSGTLLESPFESAYLDGLRNACSHNSYEFVKNDHGEVLSVRSTRTDREWTIEEIDRALDTAINLSNSIHSAAAHASQIWEAKQSGELDQLGITGTIFMPHEKESKNCLTIHILQLWCFHELDSLGRWLDMSTATITVYPDDKMLLSFDTGASYGSAISISYLDQLSSNWIEIIRVPIAPNLGMGHPVYKVEGASFEVLGIPDSHVIPLKVIHESE